MKLEESLQKLTAIGEALAMRSLQTSEHEVLMLLFMQFAFPILFKIIEKIRSLRNGQHEWECYHVGHMDCIFVKGVQMWFVSSEMSKSSGTVVPAIDTVMESWLQFLTDAGQYVVRFGDVLPKDSSPESAPNLEEAQDRKPFLSSMNEKTGAEEMKKLQQAADQVHLHSHV